MIQELEERFRDSKDLNFYWAMEDLMLLSGVVDAGSHELLCPSNEIDWSDIALQ